MHRSSEAIGNISGALAKAQAELTKGSLRNYRGT
jgi:hypothetical protein